MTPAEEEELRKLEALDKQVTSTGTGSLTPAEQSELDQLEAADQQPAPVEDSSGGSWWDTAKEVARGTGSTLAGLPDIIPNMFNTGMSAAELAIKGKTVPEEHVPLWFGTQEMYDKQFPPDPEHSLANRFGEKYGSLASIGAAAGAPGGPAGMGIGALTGLATAGVSDLAGYIGEGIDQSVGTPEDRANRRYEQLGEILGSVLVPPVRPIGGMVTRSKYASPQTPEIAAAAERQGVEPSVALLGNQAAKSTTTEPRVYRQQQERLTDVARQNVEDIRGGQPPVEEAKAPIGQSIQEKADAAATATRNEISNKQDRLTTAAGGATALQDPWSVMSTLDAKIADPRTLAQEAARLKRVQSEFEANFVPRDAALAKRIATMRAAAERTLRNPKASAQARSAAQNAIIKLEQDRRANTAITDDRLRKFNSEIKSMVESDPGMAGFEAKPVRDAMEQARIDAAKAKGFPEDRWRAEQAATEPLYRREEMLRERGTDPYATGSDYNYFFGPGGDASPGRLEAVQSSQNIDAELAAQYGLKTTPNGVLDLASGQWWGTLDDAARMLRSKGDHNLAQRLDDMALLSREMPGAPYVPEVDLAANIGAATSRAISWQNPLALLSTPRIAGPVGRSIMKYGFGTDPVAAMQRNNAQDIASLLARSTVPPTVIYNADEGRR